MVDINITNTKIESDIYAHTCNFHPIVNGFVYLDSENFYQIFVNSKLNDEMQQKVFKHELTHIKHHLPDLHYIVGADMQRHKIEKEADNLAEKLDFFNTY